MEPHVVRELGLDVGTAAAGWGIGALLIGLLVVVGLAISARTARRRARAERDVRAGRVSVLVAGPTVLHGVIEGDDAPVVLRLEETGREFEDEGTRHEWREVRRSLTAHPFDLARVDGSRVRVEPGADVELACDLDVVARPSDTNRVREARLRGGDRISAMGVLEAGGSGGYRDAATSWVLRPPRGARMVLATESLAEHLEAAARARTATLLLTVLALIGQQALVSGSYAALALFGRQDVATIARRSTYETHDEDSGTVTHHVVTVIAAGVRVSAEVSAADWEAVREGDELAIVRAGRTVQLGDSPGVQGIVLLATSVAGLAGLAIVLAAQASRRPWWARRPVVETGLGKPPP